MDLKEVQEFVEDSSPDIDVSVNLLLMQLGTLGEVLINIEHGDLDEERTSDAISQVAAGLIILAAELAHEHDADVNAAVEDVVKDQREEQANAKEVAQAMEDGDYEKLADMLLGDGTENEDTGGETRAFQ